MRDLDELFTALGRSRFRSGFRLSESDADYLRRRGIAAVLDHAAKFVRERLAGARPHNDGRQTPWRGHPVFPAQHATATCCRSCLARWHGIAKGRPLSPQQVDYIVRVIGRWLESTESKPQFEASESMAAPRSILHVDMDAFYAAIEERDNPALAGCPVIVGGTPEGRGVVAAANYVARTFGVHSAMPAATARRLCPQAVFLPTRMEHYAGVARGIRTIFGRYTPLVEPIALDEAFLDVTGSRELFGEPVEIARRLKREIHTETGLIASVGLAPNKFLAKIASDLEKPDGLVVVDPDRVREFLDPLPVGRLWGVGRKAGGILEKLGVRTIGELRRLPVEALRERLGRPGEHLRQLAHGRDDRPVVPDREAKSISHETTFPADIAELEILRAFVVAGRPDAGLTPWGSFEGWSRLIRNAVVWLDLPDPGETRRELAEQADRDAAALRALLAGWDEIDPERTGLTAR